MIRHLVRITILVLVMDLVPFSVVWAESLRIDPSTACQLMADEGLRTRGDYRDSSGVYRCTSQRKNIISGARINNSIRFIALGNAEVVTQVRLELQVKSGEGVQRAHRQLVENSRLLLKKSLKLELPAEVETAILGAATGNWDVNGNILYLDRVVAGGNGYELRFSIR